jgi:hypothetical protein
MKAYDLLAKASCNLRDYKGKKYKVTKGAVIDKLGKEYSCFTLSPEGEICIDEFSRGYISGQTEIDEIQQPIPFMEAVKAYSEGKTIRVELGEGKNKTNTYKDGYSGGFFKDRNGYAPLNIEILEGRWYVEESTNE